MSKPNSSIIGGMFGLELLSNSERRHGMPTFLRKGHIFLATARSALTLLWRHLKPPTVWLPSYLCDSVLESFAGSNVKFFAVDENLEIHDLTWLDEVRQGDMAVFIDYFGFRSWDAHGKQARDKGAYIIEDASQALLNSRYSEYADYIVSSPRKFLGVPDGGILLAQGNATLPEASLPPVAAEWWLEALKASVLRAEFDRTGAGREWFRHFQNTDSSASAEPTQMSQLSELILKNHGDLDKIANRRRDNYRYLADQLAPFAIFKDLPEETVPLGFPIRLSNRNEVQKDFFKEEIYPAIHWHISHFVPPEFNQSHVLASQILTLPLDQRYDLEDMRRIVSVLKENGR